MIVAFPAAVGAICAGKFRMMWTPRLKDLRIWMLSAWTACGLHGGACQRMDAGRGVSDVFRESDGDRGDSETAPRDTAVVADTGDVDDTEIPLPMVVCPSAPPVYTQQPPLDGPRANRSLAVFEEILVGWDEFALLVSAGNGDSTVLTPGITAYGGMVFLPNGELIVSEHLGTENLNKVTPDGNAFLLARGLRAYGVVLGPDGMVYAVGERGTIYRVDPLNGATAGFLTFPEAAMIRLADFSPDGHRLYVGTRTDDGQIWAVDLDDEVNPIDEPRIFAQTPSTFHDVLVVDACGNLIVTAFYGGGVYWITPAGEVHTLAAQSPEDHIHGAAWGSGIGAWDDRTLYLAHPNLGNVVTAWPLGVPARNWRGGNYRTCGTVGGPCPEE